MIEPFDKSKKAFILEFKVLDPDEDEKTLEDTLANALIQVQPDRRPALHLGFDGYRKPQPVADLSAQIQPQPARPYFRIGSDSSDYVFRTVSLNKVLRESVRKFRGDLYRKPQPVADLSAQIQPQPARPLVLMPVAAGVALLKDPLSWFRARHGSKPFGRLQSPLQQGERVWAV